MDVIRVAMRSKMEIPRYSFNKELPHEPASFFMSQMIAYSLRDGQMIHVPIVIYYHVGQ